MHVIRHQAESVHLYSVERFEVFQRAQVVAEIGFLRKHHLLVVPSLHYVMGVTRNHDSPKLGIALSVPSLENRTVFDLNAAENKSVPFMVLFVIV
jgi:hypothetical protein